MQRFCSRALAALFFLAMEAVTNWLLLSAAESFIRWDWAVIHDAALGRAIWLLFIAIGAKAAMRRAMEIANRHIRKTANAQPSPTA